MQTITYRRSRSSGTSGYQDVLDFSYLVFFGGSEARATVNSYCKTLQMVYQLDTKRQLENSTNDMVNAASKTYLNEFGYYHPVAAIRSHLSSLSPNFILLSSSPRTCVISHIYPVTCSLKGHIAVSLRGFSHARSTDVYLNMHADRKPVHTVQRRSQCRRF